MAIDIDARASRKSSILLNALFFWLDFRAARIKRLVKAENASPRPYCLWKF